MTEFMMLDELDEEILDYDANQSHNDMSKVDSILIKRILSEMKSEFNKSPTHLSDSEKETSSQPKELQSDSEDTKIMSSETVESGACADDLVRQFSQIDDDASKSEVNEENNAFPDDNAHDGYQTAPEMPSDDGTIEPECENEVPFVKDEEVNNVMNESEPIMETDSEIPEEPQPCPEEESEEIKLEPQCEEAAEESEPIDAEDPLIDKNESHVDSAEEPPVKDEVDNDPDFTPVAVDGMYEIKRTRRMTRNSYCNSAPASDSESTIGVKRSSRRMSKENNRESVLQSAIALKEKSFGSLNQSEDRSSKKASRLAENEQKISLRLRHRSPRFTWQESTDSACSSPSENIQRSTSRCSVKSADKSNVEEVPKDESFCKDYEEHPSDEEIEDEDDIVDYRQKSGKRRRRLPTSVNEKPSKVSRLNSNEVSQKSNKIVDTSLTEVQSNERLCECTTVTKIYARVDDPNQEIFCTGVDSVEKSARGCVNVADLDFPMIRPNSRIPFMLLCPVHIERLMRHKCCPLCGVFCTRGTFMYCKQGHFYHKDCDPFYHDGSVCPHCGLNETKVISLTLAKHNKPFCLPSQRYFDKNLSARIQALPLNKQKSLRPGDEDDDEDGSHFELPSGGKINFMHVPEIERISLKKCLSVFTSKNAVSSVRYTNKALIQAVKNEELEKAIQILWSGLNPNTSLREGTALHIAAKSGRVAMVHLLLQCGASLELLDRDQYTPLMAACLAGKEDVASYLIRSGANRTFKGVGGMTALHVAAKEGYAACCKTLLSNLPSPHYVVDAVDEGNWTPLVWAAENKRTDVVRFLLSQRANIFIRDTERNVALHWASLASSVEIVEDLLNAGSDINATNVYGDTPLHIAAREGSIECVMLLLSRGAIPDMINRAGSVPRDCCREPNQYIHDLITVSMKFTLVTQEMPIFPRVVSNDITRGKERFPIQCVNDIDNDPAPSDFFYVTENCITTNVQIDTKITSLIPCKCTEQPKANARLQCSTDSCKCTVNSKGCWYDDSGKLIADFNYEDPPLVFECNPACHCNELLCINRVVQKGMRQGLQMRKTENKDWGVITLRDIPKGTYVCEYVGEIISDSEADTRHDDSYLFDLDNKEIESFCIDARRYGNITRFINHSCHPNLFPVRVFINHHDLKFPRIAFFAARDIPANEELGYDYGEKFWMVKYKTFTCTCGEDLCRYSEETIHDTVRKYHETLRMEEEEIP